MKDLRKVRFIGVSIAEIRMMIKREVAIQNRSTAQIIMRQLRLPKISSLLNARRLKNSEDISAAHPLSVRAQNVLSGAGIDTIGKLCSKTAQEICKYRGSGPRTVLELEFALSRNGRRLGDIKQNRIRGKDVVK
jgi:DNA-directed RNA polymerase alpha subunit